MDTIRCRALNHSKNDRAFLQVIQKRVWIRSKDILTDYIIENETEANYTLTCYWLPGFESKREEVKQQKISSIG